ncbi:hypothetical protein HNP82_001563 [Catenibacillus scindens]|uniref:Uncharacterized protein n=1 Tax=Catenibacillus scindens TaxID=673271 RepID=A0A7W8H9L4_9FIRM|nr:hypothetical protein [Catenibacillus scindens]
MIQEQRKVTGTEDFYGGEHFSMERIDYIKRAAKRPE